MSDSGAMSPPPPPPPSAPEPPGNAWDRRDRLGFGTALVEAVKEFVATPGQAYAATRPAGDVAGPVLFAIVLGVAGAVVNQLLGLMMGPAMLAQLPPELRQQVAPFLATGPLAILLHVVVAPFVIALFLFVWSGILHLCVMLVGGGARPGARFETTLRVASFSAVADLAQVVPIVGTLIQVVWRLVLQWIGLVRMHRMSEGKAALAVLLPLLVCCACGALVALAVMSLGLAAFAGRG